MDRLQREWLEQTRLARPTTTIEATKQPTYVLRNLRAYLELAQRGQGLTPTEERLLVDVKAEIEKRRKY